MISLYIFINRIQPFEAAKISAAFFLCRLMRKNNRCHTFKNKTQDDISFALAMYSYISERLDFLNGFHSIQTNNFPVSEFKEFKPRLKIPQNQVSLSAGLNLEK